MSEQDVPFQSNEKRVFLSNRGLRYVPLGWEHPKDSDGKYIPLIDRDMSYTEEEVEEGLQDGWITSREELETCYMPDFSEVSAEGMGICAYENTTEGTPISPVVPNSSQGRFELARYCAENHSVFADVKGDVESWAAILFGKNIAIVDAETRSIEIHDTFGHSS